MSRVLLALLALLALTAAVAWYAFSLEPQGSATAPARVRDDVADEAAPAELRPADDRRPTHGAAEGTAARSVVKSAREEALANARWVEGRVLFPPGTPPDEELVVVADDRDLDDGGDHRARVEPDGRFRVAFSERTRSGSLRLEGRYLFLREPVAWKRGQVEPVAIAPELGGRIETSALPPAGTPAQDAHGEVSLSITQNAGSFTYSSGMQGAQRELDERLTAAHDALDPAFEYRVLYDGERFVAAMPAVTLQPGRTAYVQLELQPGTLLTGTVRDESGAPVAGARLSVHSNDPVSSGLSGRFRYVDSADDGTFRIGALPPGAFELSVEHEAYEPLERDLVAAPEGGTQALELVLVSGATIAGTVRWPDGEPASAQVFLEREASESGRFGGPRDKQTTTGDDGRFEVSGLTAGRYRVRVGGTHTDEVLEVSPLTGRERTRKRRSRWVAEAHGVAVGTRELELVLAPGLSVRGRVLDAQGAPLDDAYVAAEQARVSFGYDEEPLAPSGRFRNDDGSFELTGFLPGEWTLHARAKGFTESDGVTVQVPGDAQVELRLEREATVRGVVLDLDGRPAAGAPVQFAQPGHDDDRQRFVVPEERTDAEGAFELGGLHGGLTRLTAFSVDGVPGETLELELVAGETRAGLVLTLRAGCELEGQVVDRAGRPEVGLHVQLNVGENEFTRIFQTDQEGRFQGRGLPAGEASVFAKNGDGISLHERVDLRPGTTARVRLAAPPEPLVRVHGRLLAAGEPLADAWVMARREDVDLGSRLNWGSVQSRHHSDAEGRYELRLPGAGRWLVQVHDASRGSLRWTVPLDVPEVEDFERDIELGFGHVRGQVRSRAGEPLELIRVRSEPLNHDGGPRGLAVTLTDADGRYELAVPAGRHALVAGGDPDWDSESGWCAARVDDLRVEDGAALEGVDFELEPGAALSGSVRAPGGGPARFASLWACGPTGTERLGMTDENGGFQLAGLREGTLWLRASTRSAATPAATSVSVRRGTVTRLDLQLAAGVPLRVRVLDAAGQPLGSELEVRGPDGHPVPAIASGELGDATFGPLTPGTYRVTARRESKLTERTLEVSGLEDDLELVLGFE